jgi:TatA/E family protein of Tat protein translocase
MGAFSIWHWLIVLAIVLLIFGSKKFRSLGGDLGASIKAFRESVREEPPHGDPMKALKEPGAGSRKA